jgi:hypothetical protein
VADALVKRAKAKLVELLADDSLAIDFSEAAGYAAASVACDPDEAEAIARVLWQLPDAEVDVPVRTYLRSVAPRRRGVVIRRAHVRSRRRRSTRPRRAPTRLAADSEIARRRRALRAGDMG